MFQVYMRIPGVHVPSVPEPPGFLRRRQKPAKGPAMSPRDALERALDSGKFGHSPTSHKS